MDIESHLYGLRAEYFCSYQLIIGRKRCVGYKIQIPDVFNNTKKPFNIINGRRSSYCCRPSVAYWIYAVAMHWVRQLIIVACDFVVASGSDVNDIVSVNTVIPVELCDWQYLAKLFVVFVI